MFPSWLSLNILQRRIINVGVTQMERGAIQTASPPEISGLVLSEADIQYPLFETALSVHSFFSIAPKNP